MYITKETKWPPSCHCHGNSYAAGPVLIKAKTTPNIIMGRVKTIWEPCVFREKPSVPLANVANGGICFFTERDWRQEYCHGNNIVGITLFLLWCTFLVPSLKNTAPIFPVSHCLSVTIYNVITFLICIIQKCDISKTKKRYSKKENTILLYFEKPFK